MSDAKKDKLASELEAREVAESAREQKWKKRSFMKELFAGKFSVDLIDPPPKADSEEQARAAEFMERLATFVDEHIDGDANDRNGWVPQSVLDGLAELGAFGIKIPREYGGLGLSQRSYNRALALVASRCSPTGAFLSAHQSIGVPTPLMLFGTPEQKEKYLPRLAKGALSAFALTEENVGSDPANMATTATLSEDGEHWILDGEKLWTTNGPRSELMVVMARTPAPKEGKGKRPITAFIVETAWEGVGVKHLCSFMGLKGLSNGVITLDQVKVPKENMLWEEGSGLKLALITLNTGRLALPAFCAAAGKALVRESRLWAAKRVQWGAAIGKHDAVAQKLGRMAADTFAMEAVAELTAGMSDAKTFDIRIEAAAAKLWHSEKAWELVNDALQIRGGRAYETQASLEARGAEPNYIERTLRDLRINLIFEGSSEIMHLFVAREAVDSHLRVAGDMINPRAPMSSRIKGFLNAGLYYAWWYPTRWVGWGRWPAYGDFQSLATHMRYVDRTSRKLARTLFYAMMRFGGGLERRQLVLARLVDIGTDLFVMTSACIHAKALLRENPGDTSPMELADTACRHARGRIRQRFSIIFRNNDVLTYGVAQKAMEGRYAWLERGIAPAMPSVPVAWIDDRLAGREGVVGAVKDEPVLS